MGGGELYIVCKKYVKKRKNKGENYLLKVRVNKKNNFEDEIKISHPRTYLNVTDLEIKNKKKEMMRKKIGTSLPKVCVKRATDYL